MSNQETVVTTARRGRPVIEGSNRQARLAAQAARVEAGGEIKRGRPVNADSARQARLATRVPGAKPGRPAKVKPQEEAVEAVEA